MATYSTPKTQQEVESAPESELPSDRHPDRTNVDAGNVTLPWIE